jgi:hypothetical protein
MIPLGSLYRQTKRNVPKNDLEGADMRHQHRLRPLGNRLGRLALAIALGLVAVSGLLALVRTPAARAASQGDVFVYPLAGGPGTHVYLQLNFFGDPQLYQIKVATKPTAEGGCDSAQTLSGDGGKPIQLGGQDATTLDFDWPKSLTSNAYYFCVFPMSSPTAAPTATATATSQVTPTGSPAATATPRPTPVVTPVISGPNEANSTIPFVYTRDTAAKVALPAQSNFNIVAGSQIQLALTNWLSKNRAAPTSVWVAPTGHQDTPNEDAPVNATFSVSSPPDSKGNCTLLVTIPSDLDSAPGSKTGTRPYLLIVGGPGIYQRSDPFAVNPALSPTVSVTATPPPSSGSGGGGLLLVLGWIVAVLAFLGAIGGVLYLALNSRRAKPDAQQPQSSAPWGATDEPWGGPQGNLWDDPPQDSWGGVSTNWGQGGQGPRPDWDAPTEPGRWPGDRP